MTLLRCDLLLARPPVEMRKGSKGTKRAANHPQKKKKEQEMYESAGSGHERERERERELLLKRETEHLWLRQLMHGIGGGPR